MESYKPAADMPAKSSTFAEERTNAFEFALAPIPAKTFWYTSCDGRSSFSTNAKSSRRAASKSTSGTFESRICNRSCKYCVLPAASAATSMAPNGIATPVGALNANGEECESLESFSSFAQNADFEPATETAKSSALSESFAKDNGSFAYDVSAAIEIVAAVDAVAEAVDTAGADDEAPPETGASVNSIFTSPGFDRSNTFFPSKERIVSVNAPSSTATKGTADCLARSAKCDK
mmetsp:Transcript_262/g.903  ORF Transcript_262/g.903 Transcript_262/m.903 type:complete len:234 (-) Transcript_262:2739-3440(-)